MSYSGCYAGVFLSLVLSGALADKMGWQAPFYFYGGAGVLWFCVWQLCVFPKPSLHPCISDEEREHIETSIGENMDLQEQICDMPWKNIFTSLPVYAIIVANIARNWSVYLLTTQPTKYFSDVYKYDVFKSGLVSSFPHLVMFLVVLGGQLADEMRKRWFSTTVVRKIFNCTGFGLEGAFLLGVGYSTNASISIACLILAGGISGLAISGYSVNHLDIAPRYASILMGLSNGIGCLAGISVPMVTGYLAWDHTQQSWSHVFLTASLIHFAGIIFYAMFASGEKQDWANPLAPQDEKARSPEDGAAPTAVSELP